MPVRVTVESSGSLLKTLESLTGKRIGQISKSFSREATERLRQLIFAELQKRWSQLEVSKQARDAMPGLRDLVATWEAYRASFVIQDDGGVFSLVIDRDALERAGMPRILPEVLEYGSELGVPPIAHLRPAWSAFKRSAAIEVLRDTFSELA